MQRDNAGRFDGAGEHQTKIVKRALAQRRPWLLASIIGAVSWWFFADSHAIPGLFKVVWKGLPLILLALYAFQRHLGPDGHALTGLLLIAGVADSFSELQYASAATLMGFSLLLGIWLYARNRRDHTVTSQKILALVLVIAVPVISWFLLRGEEGRLLATGFSLLLAIMAATAWTSRFSRYRVGAGAVLFVVSDLLLFATLGPVLHDSPIATKLVWPLYYSGQLLIATGVVSRLRRDAAA
ncbi:lysoplasmalogenase family protein [Croceicoccus sediminis]|uniref:lysoplasmalogenase family protein n=1 Tax=Croceicoccus sediminis TaxID=2571150 RepID=UPI0014797E42|nr:lysoplasmalogenase family protein [Croceicoccus sediminis]